MYFYIRSNNLMLKEMKVIWPTERQSLHIRCWLTMHHPAACEDQYRMCINSVCQSLKCNDGSQAHLRLN